MRNLHQYQCLLILLTAVLGGIGSNVDITGLLWRTLTALERGLQFFEDEHENLNLDAIIGSRLVSGKLSILLSCLFMGHSPLFEEDEDDSTCGACLALVHHFHHAFWLTNFPERFYTAKLLYFVCDKSLGIRPLRDLHTMVHQNV